MKITLSLCDSRPSKSQFVKPITLETARFGQWNGITNQAPYDTHGVASDGTYGAFLVFGGVITPTTSNLIPGNYDVGGYPVKVSINTRAVASQIEFDTATTDVNGLDGLVLVVRYNAQISNTDAWYHRAVRRISANCQIIGDGIPTWEKSSFHFGHVTFDNCSNTTWHNLAFRSFTMKSDSTFGPVKNAILEGNHFGDSDPDVHADYSTIPFNGIDCFSIQNGAVHGLQVLNNTFRGGGSYAQILFWYENWGELVGNHFDKYYGDAIKIRGNAPLIVAANITTRPFSKPSDASGPHSDSLQIEQSTGQSTDVFEANFFIHGNSRGTVSGNLYIAGGPGFNGSAEANGAIATGYYGNRATSTAGLIFDNNGALPPPGFAGTVGSYQRNTIDTDQGGGTTLRNSFGGTVSAPASVNTSGNIQLHSWDNTALSAALPGWAAMTMDRPTYAQALVSFTPASDGALAGKGPGAVIVLPPRTRADGFKMPTLRPIPTLGNIRINPVINRFDATLKSSVAKRPLFWAVIPIAQVVSDWREIKERTIPGGLDFGFSAAGPSGTISITGTPRALASATDYELLMVQENGWTTRSKIIRSSFSTP